MSRRLAGKAAKRKEFKEDFAILDVNEDDLKGDPRVWLTKVTSSYSSSYLFHVFHSAKNSIFFVAAIQKKCTGYHLFKNGMYILVKKKKNQIFQMNTKS